MHVCTGTTGTVAATIRWCRGPPFPQACHLACCGSLRSVGFHIQPWTGRACAWCLSHAHACSALLLGSRGLPGCLRRSQLTQVRNGASQDPMLIIHSWACTPARSVSDPGLNPPGHIYFLLPWSHATPVSVLVSVHAGPH